MIFLLDGTFFPGWGLIVSQTWVILIQINCCKMIQLGSLWAEKMTFRNEGTEGKSDCAKKAEKKKAESDHLQQFLTEFQGF